MFIMFAKVSVSDCKAIKRICCLLILFKLRIPKVKLSIKLLSKLCIRRYSKTFIFIFIFFSRNSHEMSSLNFSEKYIKLYQNLFKFELRFYDPVNTLRSRQAGNSKCCLLQL